MSYCCYTGELDEMVSFEYGQRTAQFVQTFNKTNHQFKSYGGLGHSSSPQVSYSPSPLASSPCITTSSDLRLQPLSKSYTVKVSCVQSLHCIMEAAAGFSVSVTLQLLANVEERLDYSSCQILYETQKIWI